MQLGSSTSQIPDGLLAAMTLLSEKPHQGVPSRNLALHQGIDERNSTAALGLRASEHLNRVWPRYTGKERDTESGNDYFNARYYASSMGRFLSPDGVGGRLEDPQSWNFYGYVQNNPVKNTDPDGHDCIVQTRTGDNTEDVSRTSGNCDNVQVNTDEGQSKTYIAGVVKMSSVTSDGSGGITFGYTSYSGDAGVADLKGPPFPENTNLDPFWGNNAQGYGTFRAANTLVTDAAVATGVVYGGLAAAAMGPGAAAAVGRWGLQRLAMGASSPALMNLINHLYQAQDEIPGGTAGAVRNEVMTGEFINGGHTIKASEMISALTNLINSGQLGGSDKMIARLIISDLKSSLGR